MTFYEIPGYEGLYEINEFGDVLSLPKKLSRGSGSEDRGLLLLKQSVNSFGYKYVVLVKNGKKSHSTIHRLLSITFKPNPENLPCVNHIDGVKANNNLSNLEWCTHKENNDHAIRTGLAKRATGESARSKLKSGDIPVIRKMFGQGYSFGTIGNHFSVSHGTISAVIRKKTWTHI